MTDARPRGNLLVPAATSAARGGRGPGSAVGARERLHRSGDEAREQLALDALPDGVARGAVDGQLRLLRPGGLRWIREAPVQALLRTEEEGAGFVGVVADGDHGVERLA